MNASPVTPSQPTHMERVDSWASIWWFNIKEAGNWVSWSPLSKWSHNTSKSALHVQSVVVGYRMCAVPRPNDSPKKKMSTQLPFGGSEPRARVGTRVKVYRSTARLAGSAVLCVKGPQRFAISINFHQYAHWNSTLCLPLSLSLRLFSARRLCNALKFTRFWHCCKTLWRTTAYQWEMWMEPDPCKLVTN